MFMILLKGQPGSGKSTLGVSLAKKLQIPLIDKDDSRNAFQFLALTRTDINWNNLSYDVMFNTVKTQLDCNLSVIIDCPLARRELFNRAHALASQHSASVVLVECIADDRNVWEQRLSLRGEQDKGTCREHKPNCIDDADRTMIRNNGSEKWSDDDDIADALSCRVVVETTKNSIEEQMKLVLDQLG